MRKESLPNNGFIKSEVKRFKDYVYQNRWIFLLFALLFLLVYITWLVNPTPRIDGEILINSRNHSSIYLQRGQGNLWTEYLFDSEWFNPMFSCLFSFLFLICGMILLGYLSYRAGIHKTASAILGAFILTNPIMIELIYFDMLLFKASWAFILSFAATGLTFIQSGRMRSIYWLIALFLLYWAIATYEAFAAVYVTTIVFIYIAKYYKGEYKKIGNKTERVYLLYIVRSIAILLGAIVLNVVVGKMFSPSENTYLTGKILWNQRPIVDSLRGIVSVVKNGMLGVGPFYTPFMFVLNISVIIFALVHYFSNKKTLMNLIYVAACIVLQICPYLMSIVLGGYADAIRTQLTYPMVIGLDIVLLFTMCNGKVLRSVIALLSVCIMWTQTQTTMRLEYTDQVRGKEDLFVAHEMIQRVDQVCDNINTPIYILGTYKDILNESCMRGEMIGTSIFGYSDFMSPAYSHSSLRTILILKTLGIERNSLMDPELIREARKKALDMPCYPMNGCVMKTDQYIIFKLSEDQWADNLEFN